MLTTSFFCRSFVGGFVGAGAGRLGGSGLEGLGRGFCGVRGASGSMKLFSSVSSCGGFGLSSLNKIKKQGVLCRLYLRLSSYVFLYFLQAYLCSRGCPCSLLHSWEDRQSMGSHVCKANGPTSSPCLSHITTKAYWATHSLGKICMCVCDHFEKWQESTFKILVDLQPTYQSCNCERTSQQMCLLWWIVADKIDGFGPNLSPHIHVVTQVDGTANPTACGPYQL